MSSPTDVGEVTYTRVYRAPRELVFDCMTMPEHLAHFWGPVGMSTPLANITVDLRPGGVFATTMVNDSDGGEYAMQAVYVEVDRPRLLSWTEPGVEGGATSTITFNDLGDGTTEVIVHQTNIPAMLMSDEAQDGMRSSFDKFDAYVTSL